MCTDYCGSAYREYLPTVASLHLCGLCVAPGVQRLTCAGKATGDAGSPLGLVAASMVVPVLCSLCTVLRILVNSNSSSRAAIAENAGA